MGEEEGKGRQGQPGVIPGPIKGPARFCFTSWPPSLLTGVLFHQGTEAL